MAKFRLVHTSFWNDPKVIEEMTPEDKFFFLYLMTNEHTTQIGIYNITKKQIAFEMGYSIETINALMQRFEDFHKIIKYNSETREIAIKNWGKYNLVRGGKPILDCVKSELKCVKDASLIEYVAPSVENASIKALYDTSHVTSTIRGQEEEKEKEEEEYNNAQISFALLESQFEQFWSIYPKKVDKKKALEKFKVKIKKYGFEMVMQGTASYAKVMQFNGTEKQYIKGPAVFLNNDNFLDDHSELLKTKGGKQKPIWEVIANGPTGSSAIANDGERGVQRAIAFEQ